MITCSEFDTADGLLFLRKMEKKGVTLTGLLL